MAGPDAAGFLQGQLTNDVVALGNDQARLAGYCSAKGRLLASFVVVVMRVLRQRLLLRGIAAEIVEAILGDLGARADGEMLLLVNGFGGTPLIELYLMYHAARRALQRARVVRSLVGNYVTSLDMAGCSITLCMLDAELKRLWDAPVHTPALRWGT